MKILALSDRVVDTIYSPRVRDKYGDVDLIIGCGDLPYYYLEYVVTMVPAPLVFVYGNHDQVQFTSDGRILRAPEGGRSIDGRVVSIGDLLIAGLGGSMRYQPRALHQYTEAEMWQRVLNLVPSLLLNKLRYGRYLDILVTHSPPYGIHDGTDLAHTGFKSFLTFMRYFRPGHLLHGHKHMYRRDRTHTTTYEATTVVNVYPSRLVNWSGGDSNG